MYSNIFDTHAHYDDEKFNEDRDEILSSLPSLGIINVINCGCDYQSCCSCIELSERYNYIYSAVGVHPENISDESYNELDKIKELSSHSKCVAIGEIGLDYHYDFVPKVKQIEIFEQQIIFSIENNLPIIVHDREAHEDTMKILNKYKPKGVLHCFSGSAEMAKEVIKIGMYIGIGGAVTFKNARKPVEVAKFILEDKLLLETDCPYMSPVPFRGKRNSSDMIAYTAEKIAEIRNTDAQHIIDIANKNAHDLFNI